MKVLAVSLMRWTAPGISKVRYGHAAELIYEIAEQKLDAQIVVDTGRAEGGGVMQTLPLPVSLSVIATAHLFLTTSFPTLKTKRTGEEKP
jgi:hypothetical protein